MLRQATQAYQRTGVDRVQRAGPQVVIIRQLLEVDGLLHLEKCIGNVPLLLVHIAVPAKVMTSAPMPQHSALCSHIRGVPEGQRHLSQPSLRACCLVQVLILIPDPQQSILI